VTLTSPLSVLATGHVASRLDRHAGMLRTLDLARRNQFVVDAGGFFGATGYHDLGQGKAESEILRRLYDAVLPTTVGFSHYLAADQLREKCVATNLTGGDGSDVFPRSAIVRVGARETVVLGAIGREQFTAIPDANRAGVRWHPPAEAIRAVALRPARSRPAAFIVLSCCGPAETTQIANLWPHGTCVIITSGPGQPLPGAARAAAVSPPADGSGYSRLIPAPRGGWQTGTHRFPANMRGPRPAQIQDLHALLDKMTADLAAPPPPGTTENVIGPLH
jgi:hypothetical protein